MELKDLHNKHTGKTACILGAGPSLRNVDIDSLINSSLVKFCVNSSIAKMPNPDYYVTDDEGTLLWTYHKDFVEKSSAIKLLYRYKLFNRLKNKRLNNVIYFDHRDWGNSKIDAVSLTDNPSVPIIGARTSMASAVHLAYIMGIRRVLLLGVDHKKIDGKRYYFEFTGQPQVKPLHPEVVSEERRGTAEKHFKEFKEYWNIFNKSNRNKIEIYDCSQGDLIIFPHIDIQNAMQRFKL